MKEYLKKQIEYEYWANLELHHLIASANPIPERVPFLYSHILNSSSMWLSRLNGAELKVTLFQERTMEENKLLLEENNTSWINYLNNANDDELNRIVTFIFPLDGTKKKIKVMDAITHILHHSSYHRGQMIAQLKHSVPALPLLAYLIFSSEPIAE